MDLRTIPGRAQFLAFGVALLSLGFLVGRLAAEWSVRAPLPVLVKEDGRQPSIPIVRIEGVREGRVVGVVGSGARLVLGETLVVPGSDGSFTADPMILLRDVREVSVPEGMRFVASRRGKKYYPVGSSEAARLAPQNRIYFGTEGEAQAAGYRR